jgi:diguanylate cyclase (GGDEF)-like protein
VEFRKFTRDGRLIWLRDEAVLVRDGGGAPLYWQGVVQDITERKALEEQLEHQALHDSLTDLPNRALFIDRLRHALMRTKRRKDGMVAVLFMDLDGFKDVNDSMGHEAGDLLLVVVAERLRRCLRPEDTLARFGGDEFVVLIEDAQGPDGAVRLAERITTELKKPFSIEGKELFIAASIGIALGEDRTKSPEEILRDADTAMYRAKDQAADYSVFDPAMYLWAVGRLELQNDLRRAAERNEFILHYQPIVSLEDGTIQGVEALVRWVHPERGILNPDEFVPVAEMSGLVLPMGEKILEEACRQAQIWQAKYARTSSMFVSVNVSAKHLARPDLASMVEETLEKTGMDANRLSLDITETAYVEVLDGNRAALARLRALGVRLSIDDFGTGYSSLSYLKRLPADTLKIDKTFMRGLGVDIQDTAVVRTVVELAHTFGMHVIAEGVETEEQAALLYEMGCDSAQGYLFSKPLEPHAFVELLTSAYGRSLPEL